MLYRFFIKNNHIAWYCPIESVELMSIDYDLTIDKEFEQESFFVVDNGDVVVGERPTRPDFI